jgi:antitoxin YefM
MPIDTTYTSLRENLAAVLDRVTDDQEVVIVRRRGAKDVALIPADELNSLLETAHLLRSPANARRLKASMQEARQGKGRRMSLKQLRRAVGLDAED